MSERKQRLERLYLYVTPIWNHGMGHRLAVARMKMLRTQEELARLLTTDEARTSQQTLGRIELGRVRTGTFTLARLRATLGEINLEYVLFGSRSPEFNEALIKDRFYTYRLKMKPGQKPRGNPITKAMSKRAIPA